MKAKCPSESSVEMRQIVMPNHANAQNTIFGGTIMSWIDIAAAMVAQKHARTPVVTIHVDEVSFKAPVKVGHHVLIQASLNFVGNTSMEIGVKVTSENPITGEQRITTRAFLTFVSLDDLGKPKKVPALKVETDDEKRRYRNAQKRVEARKNLQKSLK